MNEQERTQRYRERVKQHIVTLEDGYYYYEPPIKGGVFGAWELRVIADYLDELNKPWDAEVQAYFSGEQANDATSTVLPGSSEDR
jgi:hypothetical protein